jgi:hypothetical protein
MAKYKGAKWAQILTLMAAIAASVVSGVAEAKAYADGLSQALSAGDIWFTSSNFTANNVGSALEELYSGVTGNAVSISTQTTSTGMLRSYTFTQNGQQIGVIDIPKDYVNNIIGIVSQDGSGNSGVFLKVNTAPTGETASYEYVDASGLVEYLTVGTQTGKMVTLTIDSATHTITADIADGTLTKEKLDSSVQASLGKADSALQEADFEWATDNEVTTAWAAAMATAATPASPGNGEGE